MNKVQIPFGAIEGLAPASLSISPIAHSPVFFSQTKYAKLVAVSQGAMAVLLLALARTAPSAWGTAPVTLCACTHLALLTSIGPLRL